MRISLDFYRILGVTNRATPDQILQAHHDRLLSMPRKEYSEAAITSRRRLIDSAFAVLSDSAKRQHYDYQILAKPESRVQLAIMEVDDREITGVLLILQELGDFDQIISLSRTFLERNRVSPLAGWTNHDPDVLLATAIAHAEIGREQRRQGKYQQAATSLEAASQILLQASSFLTLRNEIQIELLKLCPYRVLELLASKESSPSDRQEGMKLLRQMLNARGGIEGQGEDHSGLKADFVQFIQKLRPYMTVAEQQQLFEEESKRPSLPATYLAVHALIGGGFSQHQPGMIRRAKGLLVQLSSRQDVAVEQAICALLLGQQEEAIRALERSHSSIELDQIRQDSGDDPHLLSGLCKYTGKWLQTEVYPHFRDLTDQIADIHQYFSDPEVTEYLERLPQVLVESQLPLLPTPLPRMTGFPEPRTDSFAPSPSQASQAAPLKLPSPSPRGIPSGPGQATNPQSFAHSSGSNSRQPPMSHNSRPAPPKPQARPRRKSTLKIERLILVIVVFLGIVLGLPALAFWWWRSQTETTVALVSPLANQLIQPLTTQAIAPVELDQALALQTVTEWQNVKAKALGKEYQVDLLSTILTDPALSNWRSRAQDLKADNSHIEYVSKSLDQVSFTPEGKNKGILRVKIQESRNLFRNGTVSLGESNADSKYEASYNLVLKGDKILIENMQVHD
ncbi:MAG: IMS domain-containing protein [Pseudanabaenaceae cyanobacterium bins.68]|nr:IMS domain-containing protein [Pseudanabaenaceae cyanobacterium bins.68]